MVSNVEKLLAFYKETLGFEVRENYGSKYAEVQTDGFVIGLHLKNSSQENNSPTSNMMIGLRVEDLENSMKELKSKDVTFSTPIEDGAAGKFAYFEDPEGNQLYLWQSKY